MNRVKIKSCKFCGNKFTPKYSTTQTTCSVRCAIGLKKQKEAIKVKKPFKPIRKFSIKREAENRRYTIERLRFLAQPENQRCPITGERATEIHHKKGRIESLLLDTRYWLAVSRNGHREIEENPDWAKEQGYSLSRLSK